MRLSRPGSLTYSGRFTHISGHPSAAGRAQYRESSPVKDQRSTAVPRNQLNNSPPAPVKIYCCCCVLAATRRLFAIAIFCFMLSDGICKRIPLQVRLSSSQDVTFIDERFHMQRARIMSE